jgi:hypothetical protein
MRSKEWHGKLEKLQLQKIRLLDNNPRIVYAFIYLT